MLGNVFLQIPHGLLPVGKTEVSGFSYPENELYLKLKH
jgi:hypothetical protein